MKHVMIFMIAIFLLLGCQSYRQPEEVKISSNEGYEVEKLFEVDGVTVYRFLDNGRYIYFTNRTGEAGYTYRRRSGKAHETDRVYVLCN